MSAESKNILDLIDSYLVGYRIVDIYIIAGMLAMKSQWILNKLPENWKGFNASFRNQANICLSGNVQTHFLQHGSDYKVVANWQCRDREAQGRLWSVVYGNYEIKIRIFKM